METSTKVKNIIINQSQETKIKKSKTLNIKISSLNIDKAEYQEIVLSNSNFPDRDY